MPQQTRDSGLQSNSAPFLVPRACPAGEPYFAGSFQEFRDSAKKPAAEPLNGSAAGWLAKNIRRYLLSHFGYYHRL